MITYWLILFEKPESIDYTGPKKWKISKTKFERVCDSEVIILQFDDADYRMDEKKYFSIENSNGETTDSFVVCEAHKLKRV